MSDLRRQVLALRRAEVEIPRAQLASSPHVLRKVFSRDPSILRILSTGDAALPFVAEGLKNAGKLDETSLAAFAFVIENTRPEAAAALLGPLFRKAVERPGPFFVHFAAQALRRGLGATTTTHDGAYSPTELAATRAMLR